MTRSLGKLFNQLTDKHPNKFVIKFNNNEKYSYSELNAFSENFIDFFKTLKIKNNDRIAIESDKNIYSYAIIIACLKMGVSYTFIDLSEAPQRFNLIIQKLNPLKIFTFSKKFNFKNNILLDQKKLKKIDKKKIKKRFKPKNSPKIAYIMFTSGSTGRPKGVQISHKNLFFLINWAKDFFKLDSSSTISNLNPLHFDNSIFDFYCSIFNGSSIMPVSKTEIFNFKRLKKKINELNCNIWFSVPSLINLILKINSPKIFKDLKIQKFIFGGEPFPINSMRKIHKFVEKSQIYNVSGPTECTCICSAHLVNKKELFSSTNISIGKINKYFNYKILNNSKVKLKRGELLLEGPAVSIGYVNDKIITKEKFYLFKKKEYGYKTGDLVKLDKKNFLHILGRTDNQVKILGHRVELEEIENKINQIFNLNQCLVILKQIKEFPNKKLILLTDNRNLINNNYKEKLLKHLPRYMSPEEIKNIKSFKFNRNGKIDRKFYEKKFK